MLMQSTNLLSNVLLITIVLVKMRIVLCPPKNTPLEIEKSNNAYSSFF